MTRDDAAAALWRSVYHDLSAPAAGLAGAITGRAEAQVLRLSLIYALLDGSPTIGVPHLTAALALWAYAEASVRIIFGGRRGNAVADTILNALRERGRLSRTQISALFTGNRPSPEIDAALQSLAEQGLATRYEAPSTGGRPAEMWRVVAR